MHRTRFDSTLRIGVLAVIVIVAGAIIMGAGRGSHDRLRPVYTPGDGEVIVPRTRIIQLNGSVAMFDSATGAVFMYSGDAGRPTTRAVWVPHVPGVDGRTSGYLDIQHPRGVHAVDAPFLVDLITGETWVLRPRAGRAAWQRIGIHRG